MKWIIPGLAACGAAMLVLALGQSFERQMARESLARVRAETLNHTATLRARVEGEMNSILFLTSGLASYVSLHPDIDQPAFRHLARELMGRRYLSHITLAPDNVIRFVYPQDGNEAVLGLDLLNHPQQGASVRRLMQERHTVLAGPHQLVQGGTALIVRNPIFVDDGDGGRRYWGLTSIPVMMDRFYAEIGLYDGHYGDLAVALRGRDGLGAAGDIFHGDAALFAPAAEAVIQDIALLGGVWQIAARPAVGWDAAAATYRPWRSIEILLAVIAALLAWTLARQAIAVRVSEARYRDLVENVNSIVLRWKADGSIVFINAYGAALFGYRPDELRGRSLIGTIVPVTDSSGRDLAAMIRELALDTTRYAVNENENLCRDGRRLWISWTNRPLRDAQGGVAEVLSIGADHSRQRATELALRESESRFRTLVGRINGAVYRCNADEHWTMEFISDAITGISGYPATEFIHNRLRSFASIIHPADREAVTRSILSQVAKGANFELEYRIRHADGSTRWVHERGQAAYDARGHVATLDGVIFDITERKRVEAQLIEARDAADSASRAKSVFLANMSHELRTPLNAVLGYSELLRDELAKAGQANLVADLGRIHDAGEHLLSLIDDVLNFSRIESGHMRLHLETFAPAQEIRSVLGTVQLFVERNDNTLLVELAPDLGEMHSDRAKLRQILLNLLGNAAKFTRGGNIRLHAVRTPQEDGDWLEVEVNDTGIGIDDEHLAHLFEPFTQGDDTTTRRYGGTGLGLAISRRYCERLGGRITVRSRPRQGTTFTLRLPMQTDDTGSDT